jgi:hypothetical protein
MAEIGHASTNARRPAAVVGRARAQHAMLPACVGGGHCELVFLRGANRAHSSCVGGRYFCEHVRVHGRRQSNARVYVCCGVGRVRGNCLCCSADHFCARLACHSQRVVCLAYSWRFPGVFLAFSWPLYQFSCASLFVAFLRTSFFAVPCAYSQHPCTYALRCRQPTCKIQMLMC